MESAESFTMLVPLKDMLINHWYILITLLSIVVISSRKYHSLKEKTLSKNMFKDHLLISSIYFISYYGFLTSLFILYIINT